MDFKIKSQISKKSACKKGQVTIFVIISLLLVVAIILLFILYKNQQIPGVRVEKTSGEELESCIKSYLEEAVDLIFENSGYIELPELTYQIRNIYGYYKQENEKKIPYLCYTAINYVRCIPQEPFFVNHIEDEIKNFIIPKVEICFENLRNRLQERNYETMFGITKNLDVELNERGVQIYIEKEISQTKAEKEERFSEFKSNYKTRLYDVAKISEKIITEEVKFCNSDYVEVMRNNKLIEITKFQTGDDVKVYSVKDLPSKKEFKFAVRNCVLATPS
ncbi:MAG: hypothetical protein QW727_00800 [Candidatus Pacearchaeota archaeon]